MATTRNLSAPAFAILRIISGIMFALHGTMKLFGWPGGTPPVAFGTLPGWAGIIELTGGTLIAIGLFVPVTAFLCSGEMAVAYFKVHFPNGFFPQINKGELAVVYCFLFLFMAAHGAGIWSVDSTRRRTR